MKIVFDPAKDLSNLRKHDVSLCAASEFLWDRALIWRDRRKNYLEPRHFALGLIGNRVYFMAFVDRGQSRRIISLRKANAKEVSRYVQDT